MKEQRGITLVVLIITIVVMLIIAGVSIKAGVSSNDQIRLKAFYTQLEVIQKRVDGIASTNENYIDNDGNVVYLKNKGEDLTDEQKASLQNILVEENIIENSADISDDDISNYIKKFRYFTSEDLKNILDIREIEQNVYINFDDRLVVSAEGIECDGVQYHALKNNVNIVKKYNKEKNKGQINDLEFEIKEYGASKYKITVKPSNLVGDIGEEGTVKYRNSASNYWQTSNNLEMIVDELTDYYVRYQDLNENSIEKRIKVILDEESNPKVIPYFQYDFDDDGDEDEEDLEYLGYYAVGMYVGENIQKNIEKNGDLNSDGNIDGIDVTIMEGYLSGKENGG